MTPEYYQANRERLLAASKARYERKKQDPEWVIQINAANRARDAANPEAKRESNRRHKAKVKADPVEAARVLSRDAPTQRLRYRRRVGIIGATDETHTGQCLVCQAADVQLVCDHEHGPIGTGQIRGWICNGCNMAIGRMGDTLEAIERAFCYMMAAREKVLDQAADLEHT